MLKRLLSVLILAALAVGPFHVFAQDEPKMEEFVSEDGLLTLVYPVEWVIQESAELPFGGVAIMNSEEALARYIDGEDPESGDRLILVTLFPLEFFALFGAALPADPSVLELTAAFATLFAEPEEPPAEDATPEATAQISEPEEIELGDDLTAGLFTVSDVDGDGAFIVRPSGTEPAFAYMIVAFSPVGEFTDEQLDLAVAVAASVEYTGAPEELMGGLMGGAEDGGADMGAELDGAALIDARCSTCHTTDRIFAADKDEAGWTATVDRMIGYGAQLSADERQAVIDFLAANQ